MKNLVTGLFLGLFLIGMIGFVSAPLPPPSCVPGSCNDFKECTSDSCDFELNSCVYTDISLGTSCSLGECDGFGDCVSLCGNGVGDGEEECDYGSENSDGPCATSYGDEIEAYHCCSESCIVISGVITGWCGDGEIQADYNEDCELDSDCTFAESCESCKCVFISPLWILWADAHGENLNKVGPLPPGEDFKSGARNLHLFKV